VPSLATSVAVPHFDAATGPARAVPPEQHTPAQAASWALTEELVSEVKEADTIVLGLPLYNFGAPSSVKAWVDHLIAPGLSVDPQTHAPLLGGRDFVVLASRGGGYGAGTPREGWDHAEPWGAPAERRAASPQAAMGASLPLSRGWSPDGTARRNRHRLRMRHRQHIADRVPQALPREPDRRPLYLADRRSRAPAASH
jgi:hypothetical protein